MSDLKYGAYWGLNFDDEVINSGGDTLNCHVVNLPSLDDRFLILKDDTDEPVLLVRSNENVILQMASAGVEYPIESTPVGFIGSKPHRPT